MPPRSPLPLLSTPSDARTATLQGLLIATIVIATLYFMREILVPLALAIMLSFVLTPPLLMLRRIKVPRVLAVGSWWARPSWSFSSSAGCCRRR